MPCVGAGCWPPCAGGGTWLPFGPPPASCCIIAPFIGMLESGAWLRNARHGNACAARLAAAIAGEPGIEFLFPVEANSVFLSAPERVLNGLRERGWRFYTFIGGGARFMFAWDADPERVDELAADIRSAAVSSFRSETGGVG